MSLLGLTGTDHIAGYEMDLADAHTEDRLLGLALSLGAKDVQRWSPAELNRVKKLEPLKDERLVRRTRQAIANGNDPLGDEFCALRSPAIRRSKGATYTPSRIVNAMVAATARLGRPCRVVDPGAGSGRFLAAAGKAFPQANLVGIEIDPVSAVLLRANLAAAGLAPRATVILDDYRNVKLPTVSGPTLFLGNPPYVRHHSIEKRWKVWLAETAERRNLQASQLAGLHVHFLLKTVEEGRPGDFGAFITSAEWLDVNYGSLVRSLVLDGLGGREIHVIEPGALPFPDAATTGAITYFEIGKKPKSIVFKKIRSSALLAAADDGREVSRHSLEAHKRWTSFTRTSTEIPRGYVELGELCRVHRGQVTGANDVWIVGPHAKGLPRSVLLPTITKARELIGAGPILFDSGPLKKVVDLPVDLERFHGGEKRAIEKFLAWARERDADKSYIAQHRCAWWSVGLREAAPILATYMARRPPVFVRNLARARHINIAHGIYPRVVMTERMLVRLTEYLSCNTSISLGRTYAGGLVKFEPREMERIPVPSPEHLAA